MALFQMASILSGKNVGPWFEPDRSGCCPRGSSEGRPLGEGSQLHSSHVLLLGQDHQVLGHKVSSFVYVV